MKLEIERIANITFNYGRVSLENDNTAKFVVRASCRAGISLKSVNIYDHRQGVVGAVRNYLRVKKTRGADNYTLNMSFDLINDARVSTAGQVQIYSYQGGCYVTIGEADGKPTASLQTVNALKKIRDNSLWNVELGALSFLRPHRQAVILALTDEDHELVVIEAEWYVHGALHERETTLRLGCTNKVI